jgi:uncharacterized protein
MSIETLAQLRALFLQPGERAQKKQLDRLDVHCTSFIGLSPFLVLASVDERGDVDASPRGGKPGFVAVVDERTLHIPDSPGNNRLDSMTNIVSTARIGLKVAVREAYLHCAKAFMRSQLWSDASRIDRSRLPSLSQMIRDQTGLSVPVETREQMLARYAPDL